MGGTAAVGMILPTRASALDGLASRPDQGGLPAFQALPSDTAAVLYRIDWWSMTKLGPPRYLSTLWPGEGLFRNQNKAQESNNIGRPRSIEGEWAESRGCKPTDGPHRFVMQRKCAVSPGHPASSTSDKTNQHTLLNARTSSGNAPSDFSVFNTRLRSINQSV